MLSSPPLPPPLVPENYFRERFMQAQENGTCPPRAFLLIRSEARLS